LYQPAYAPSLFPQHETPQPAFILPPARLKLDCI
jgi:hypothetical protein